MKNWDRKTGKNVTPPKRVTTFLEDLEKLCRIHNVSISHEDTHGSFELEEFDEHNIQWINRANLNL